MTKLTKAQYCFLHNIEAGTCVYREDDDDTFHSGHWHPNAATVKSVLSKKFVSIRTDLYAAPQVLVLTDAGRAALEAQS